jgi:hypothetical protein
MIPCREKMGECGGMGTVLLCSMATCGMSRLDGSCGGAAGRCVFISTCCPSHDMFHDIFLQPTICFTVCLMFAHVEPCVELGMERCMFSRYDVAECFTICLFISPDLDGNRGTSTKKCAPRDPQRVPKPEEIG